MTASFFGILRDRLRRFGMPAIITITAIPLASIVLSTATLSSYVLGTAFLYAGYLIVTTSRNVILTDLSSTGTRNLTRVTGTYNLNEPVKHSYRDYVKRVFDIIMALSLIFTMLPILSVIGIALLIQGRPILIRHRRVGRGGEMFPCLKFRTMVVNGDEVLRSHLESDTVAQSEWLANQKLKDDPRVTKIGRILRNSSLDELPQLLNVLRGEMSIVGPRPILPAEKIHYGAYIAEYEKVRPGLTGEWQIALHTSIIANASYTQRIEADVKYIKEISFERDLEIIVRTVPAVLKNRVEFVMEKIEEVSALQRQQGRI